ncbi:MAG: hypothetical protein LIO86_09650, partial [Lachnospiraceae bacterium]|nr:hypothetical protein [Lachnospiraceae bacterium]
CGALMFAAALIELFLLGGHETLGISGPLVGENLYWLVLLIGYAGLVLYVKDFKATALNAHLVVSVPFVMIVLGIILSVNSIVKIVDVPDILTQLHFARTGLVSLLIFFIC